MSFSGDVKTELCRVEPTRACCARAELYGALLYCHTFTAREARIITESESFARRLPELLRRAFALDFDRLPAEGEQKYIFQLTDGEKLGRVIDAFGFDSRQSPVLHINFGLLEEGCCRAAFLRGAFLAGGSVTDPRKGYHLELATSHHSVSREVLALMRELGQEPKAAQRKGNAVIYFKQSEKIEDFLTCVGAPIAAMEVMNAKLERDIRGKVNRRVNCDAANLDKAVEAAMSQVEAIRRLEREGALTALPDKLREVAALRLAHPEDTLSQLAERCDPPITKSALNHRLRKLVELGREK